MARTGNYLIPFDGEGNQQHYPESSYERVPGSDRPRRVDPEMRPNFEFEDTLTYEGFSRGRSAAYVLFRRGDGTQVTAFLKELDEMMPRLCGGHVTGRFTFIKRGRTTASVHYHWHECKLHAKGVGMSEEAKQHVLAMSTLQRALLRAGLPFGPSMFSNSEALEVVHAVEWLIETRMALRERQILEQLRLIVEEQDERTRSVVEGAGHGVLPAGDVPGEGSLDDGSEGQGAADR